MLKVEIEYFVHERGHQMVRGFVKDESATLFKAEGPDTLSVSTVISGWLSGSQKRVNADGRF